MLTIYKYQMDDECLEIELPNNHQILSFQVQNGKPCFWVKLDTEAQKFKRKFTIVGTGQTMDKELLEAMYCGTIQTNGGVLVFHLFMQ